MKQAVINTKRVRELKRERNFYGFWELETRFGTIKIKSKLDIEKEKEENKQIEMEVYEELERCCSPQ
jgi:hypothetical protein